MMERKYDIPLSVPDLRGREKEYLLSCVDDNWVSTAGPYVDEIEARLPALAGCERAVATSSGTAALHLALLALGVKAGDTVIVPDWTFGATANAVYYTGARPLLVDVSADSWTLDAGLVGELLAEQEVAAVIAVDALGHPADMDPISAACRAHGVPLVEDAAGAIGARYRGHSAGGLGDIGVFSFNGNKTVTAGGGGAALTSDARLAETMRMLSVHRLTDAGRTPTEFYRYAVIGFNYRMTNINAAVGLAQLERLDEMLARKRSIAAAYDRAFAARTDLVPMPRAAWADSSCWMYSVSCGCARDAADLIRYLESRRIQARVFWQALSSQPAYRDAPRRLTGVSRLIGERVVALPCSTGLTPAQQDRVIDAVAAWQGSAAVERAWMSC